MLDHFAGLALTGLIARVPFGEDCRDSNLAAKAYDIADEMLRIRFEYYSEL